MSELPRVAGKPTVIGVGTTLPVPSCMILDVEDFDNWTTKMEFISAMGASIIVEGDYDTDDDVWRFPLSEPMRESENYWRTVTQVTVPGADGGTFSTPTPPVAVVDYAKLWASPFEVDPSGEYLSDQVVLAILAAMGAVRAWVSTPVPTPAPERVRRAVALLASRALSEPVAVGDPILGETIGDYSVRYADPGSSSGLFIDGAIADLLAPWGVGRAYSVYTGPTGRETVFTLPGAEL